MSISISIKSPDPNGIATNVVWTWSPPPPSSHPPPPPQQQGLLPGNKADEQFIKQDSSDSKFSCDYTGRFDGGVLPPQRVHPGHVKTLEFLSLGREAATSHLVEMMNKSDRAQPM